MKKQTKWLFIIAVFVIVLVALGQNIINNQQAAKPSITSRSASLPNNLDEQNKLVNITVDFGNGKTIKGEVNASNALEALEQIAKLHNLEIGSKSFKYGTLIEKIGNSAGNSGYYWFYSVNGQIAKLAADKTRVNPGDSVLWEYKKVSN